MQDENSSEREPTTRLNRPKPPEDNWQASNMRCVTCIYWVPKGEIRPEKIGNLGRCRRRAPTLDGWPAVYDMDWCGDHKLDENKA